ncbi:MAG: hypothetical protein KKH22_00760, partial [Proteobacteria bacterium]|nr:hypothetical protein [Pseudomonadota bacterium]
DQDAGSCFSSQPPIESKKGWPDLPDIFSRISILLPSSVDVQINSTPILYTLQQAEKLGA